MFHEDTFKKQIEYKLCNEFLMHGSIPFHTETEITRVDAALLHSRYKHSYIP